MGKGDSTKKMRQKRSKRKFDARRKQKATLPIVGSTVLQGSAPQGKAAQSPINISTVTRMSRHAYNALPMADHSDGDCSFCGAYPNSPSKIVLVEGNEMQLIICKRCQKEQRPFSSYR